MTVIFNPHTRPAPDPVPVHQAAPRPRLFGGVDFGQAGDYTALAIVEQTKVEDVTRPGRLVNVYACRYLKRWQLGTSYKVII